MLTAAQEIVLICQKVLKTNYQLALPEGLAPVLRATHLPIRGTHRGILDAIPQGNSKRWQAFTAVGAGGGRARHCDRGAWREDIGVYGAAHTGLTAVYSFQLILGASALAGYILLLCKRRVGLYVILLGIGLMLGAQAINAISLINSGYGLALVLSTLLGAAPNATGRQTEKTPK